VNSPGGVRRLNLVVAPGVFAPSGPDPG
jgi:hypothetical protein